jgi:NTP pyrophosphatase (non-canonical NTP hydrolase)
MDHPLLPSRPSLSDIQEYVAQTVRYRGFADQSIQDDLLMLCEEVGELAKAIRQQQKLTRKAVDSQSFDVAFELADVLWMTLCIANYFEIDAETAFRAKEERNKQRNWR